MRLAATMTFGLAVLAWGAGCSPTVDGFPVGLTPGPGVVRGFALEQGISPNWEASGPADRAQFGAQLVHIEGTGLAVLDVSTRPELTLLGKKAPSRAACAREIEELAWIASVGDEDGDGRADAVLGFWEGDAAQVVSGASLCDEEGPTVIGGWTWADVPRTLRAAHPFVNEAGGGWLLDVSAKPSSSEEQPDGLPGGVLVTGGYGALDSPVEFTCPEGTAYAGLLPAVRLRCTPRRSWRWTEPRSC